MRKFFDSSRGVDFWRVWCKTLGHKISDTKIEADIAALLRTAWVILQVSTCLFIIGGVVANVINIIHHW